jgi:hypothetical protein
LRAIKKEAIFYGVGKFCVSLLPVLEQSHLCFLDGAGCSERTVEYD